MQKVIQDFYFVRARVRIVEYNPLTKEAQKSKLIDYDADYIEEDGGV